MSDQPKVNNPGVHDSEADSRLAVLSRFELDAIQHLDGNDLAAAQQLCGHGSQFGSLQTDSPGLVKYARNIDIAKRIRNYLLKLDPQWPEAEEHHDGLIAEGVVALTRLALLARLAATNSRKNGRLKPSNVAKHVYRHWPDLVALAIWRKATVTLPEPGLFRYLAEADIDERNTRRLFRDELRRIDALTGQGLWWDAPVKPRVSKVTDPSTKSGQRTPEPASTPFQPLPDVWLAEIGPRVLWVVNDLAPNLLTVLERLRVALANVDWSRGRTCIQQKVAALIQAELQREPWRDRWGRPLVPSFPLVTSAMGGHRSDKFEWPIRTWEQVCMLSTTVQAAHGFIALLGTAGRISEDATLTRNCVEQRPDGRHQVHGRTYKLTRALMGIKRTWPAPDVLVDALGQQARLANAWDWLPISKKAGEMPSAPQFGDQLWVSIGQNGRTGPEADFSWGNALVTLAKRLGVDLRPGGRRVHPHRFRKTIGRLAGVALWNSPLVLRQLFGHKDIEMTLHYILSDPGIREEAEKVLRELRVMHCADALQQVRDAVKAGIPNPFGGAGGARLQRAVIEHEVREATSGREWSATTSYNLAVEYTMNGLGWRLGIGFICTKLPHEAGECRKGSSRRGERGEPLISNCKPTCVNRCELPSQIALARQQRDVEEICDGYLTIASQACNDGQLLVAAHCLQQLTDTLADWPELKARYDANPQVLHLNALLNPDVQAEAATYG